MQSTSAEVCQECSVDWRYCISSSIVGTDTGAHWFVRSSSGLLAEEDAQQRLNLPGPVYGRLLADKIARHGADCWLVNTGWSGGAYGVGERMSIRHTRALLNAALDGTLAKASFRRDENFGVMVPESCPGVPSEVLNPRETWSDKDAYDAQARDLVGRFQKNFEVFDDFVDAPVREAGPRLAA